LGLNITFDFGYYSLEENVTSIYNPVDTFLYRTGGVFKEPSWFALFVAPVLDIAYKQKHYRVFFICVLGLILSTSGLAFLLIALFLLLKIKRLKFLLVSLISIALIYFIFPDIFGRISEGGSLQIRVLDPFKEMIDINNLSFIGVNMSRVYFNNTGGFINTFVFMYLSFGIIGLLLILQLFKFIFSLYTSIALLLIIMIEGCYGRIDFWIALAVCSIANSYFGEKTKRIDSFFSI
jgi:hypothetical protein